ncbi:LysM peptidoglycan-binding domain-containing protein, partial [Mesorhizobium sp. M00.F.Ca.ET.186.01.1.1]
MIEKSVWLGRKLPAGRFFACLHIPLRRIAMGASSFLSPASYKCTSYEMAKRSVYMFIYTVKPGDSLYSVAAKFEVPMAVLQSTNGLTVTTLVPGQDLVIPTKTYIVQPGDSLYAIAQMSFVTPKALQEANGLTSYALTPGKRLRLPTRVKYPVENFSYLLLTTPENDEKIIVNSAANNTYYGIFE